MSKPIFNELHDALAIAAAKGYAVSLSVHVPTNDDLLGLLSQGVITRIEKGAGSNGLTGRNENDAGVTQTLTVFSKEK